MMHKCSSSTCPTQLHQQGGPHHPHHLGAAPGTAQRRPHLRNCLRQPCSAVQDHHDTTGCSTTTTAQACRQDQHQQKARRQVLVGGTGALLTAAAWCVGLLQPHAARAEVFETADVGNTDDTITHVVYLDIAIAPRSYKTSGERTLGDKTIIPLDDSVPVGRIVLGLYGNVAPSTVGNFLSLVRSGALVNTVFSRVLPGEYIQAGQQGAIRMGQVEAERADLQSNDDLTSPAAFRARHLRPGTLSLSLAENDEDPSLRGRANYRNTEFLITTGPGPVPRLDSANLVFGRVLEGMSVVSTIASVPTFKPSAQGRQLNLFAQSIGDDRAANVQRRYGKPLKAVIIMGAGELPVPAAASKPASAAPVANTAAVLSPS